MKKDEEATVALQKFSGFLNKLIVNLNEQTNEIETGKEKLKEILKEKLKDENSIKEVIDQLDQKENKLCWKFNLKILNEFLHNYEAVQKFSSKYFGPTLLIFGGK